MLTDQEINEMFPMTFYDGTLTLDDNNYEVKRSVARKIRDLMQAKQDAELERFAYFLENYNYRSATNNYCHKNAGSTSITLPQLIKLYREK